MLPFTIDRIIMDMSYDMDDVSKDIVKWKYKFCVDFEKELQLEVGTYSQTVFDYIFNLFFFKKAFGKVEFRQFLEDFKDMDFTKPVETCNYINTKYSEFIVVYKKYFMDYFGFSHEDALYIERKIRADRPGMIQKMVEYY